MEGRTSKNEAALQNSSQGRIKQDQAKTRGPMPADEASQKHAALLSDKPSD